MSEQTELQKEFAALLLGDDPGPASARAAQLLQEGHSPLDFFQHVYTPAMSYIGDMFGRLDIFLPELMQAAENARVVNETVIQPRLKTDGEPGPKRGKVVLASVRGDLHDIGKNMVALMLEVNGFDVVDMGVDVASLDIAHRAVEVGANIVGLSSLMTTSMPYMEEVINMIVGLGLRERTAVIVGGAPITAEYASRIGADAFGSDAVDAVKQCTQLMERFG
jgi:trimethylamine corrinoid protein